MRIKKRKKKQYRRVHAKYLAESPSLVTVAQIIIDFIDPTKYHQWDAGSVRLRCGHELCFQQFKFIVESNGELSMFSFQFTSPY